jgi:hypothetical protein
MSDSGSSNFITPPPGLFPTAPTAPAAEPVPVETHSGTRQYVRPAGEPRPAAGPPAFFAAPIGAQPRAVTLTVELADGTRHGITTAAVLGRNPSASGEWAGAVQISVNDPEKSVSKTHAGIRVTPTGITVVDLNSTNGTEIVRLDGTEHSLTPEVPAPVLPGEVILMGVSSLRILG